MTDAGGQAGRQQGASGRHGHEEAEERSASNGTWLVPLALLALLVGLYLVVPPVGDFIDRAYTLLIEGDQQGFETWIGGFGAWGPAVLLATFLLQTLIPFIPSPIIMVAAVLAYGPWWGGALAWGSLLAAALLAYGIGRGVGPATVDRLIGEKTEKKVASFVERYGIWAVIVARVSPVLSTDAVSYVAGLVTMGWWKFVLATAVGTLPLTVLIAVVGSDLERFDTLLLWVSVASVTIFLGYLLVDHLRHRGER